MPEITGRLRTPRLASAPSSPVAGELYYNTTTSKLYWWNGAAWVAAEGGGSVGRAPHCLVRRVAAASLSNGVFYIVPWDQEDDDTDNMHVTNATGVTIPTTGLWHVWGQAGIDNSVGGSFAGRMIGTILCNGTDNLGKMPRAEQALPAISTYPLQHFMALVRLTAGDVITMSLYQGTGQPRSLQVGNDSGACKMGLVWISV